LRDGGDVDFCVVVRKFWRSSLLDNGNRARVTLAVDLCELYTLILRNGEFMARSIVVNALSARANVGKLLQRVEVEGRSLVIQKRGRPTA